MKITYAAIVSACLLLSACGTPAVHNTASGKSETVFIGPPDTAKAKLVSMMVNHGFNISKDTPYMISFDKPSQNIMANVLLGSKYDATPNVRATFMMAPIGGNTRVILDYAIVTNPGSAFERVNNMNNNQDTAAIQNEMDAMAASGQCSASNMAACSSLNPNR